MTILPIKPGAQLQLIVVNGYRVDVPRLIHESEPDEAASVLTAMFGRLVEPHEVGMFDGPGAA